MLYGLAGLLMLVFARSAAAAQACPPLQLLKIIRMAPANDGSVMLVPVTINGKNKLMILDTGSSATSLTQEAADELGLRVRHRFSGAWYDPHLTAFYGVNGDVSRAATTVEDLKIGGLEEKEVPVRIWPDPDLGKVDSRLIGVLSRDLLFQYDMDMDLGTATLKLFSPDHCEGQVLYWPAEAVTVIDFDTSGGHINIPVTLDGQKLTAVIDSGARVSALNADAAQRYFGLTQDSAGMRQTGTLAHNSLYPVYQHTFARLEFGGVAVSNPVLSILPDIVAHDARQSPSSFNRARPVLMSLPQVIIGMDILKKLHLYIAAKERRMYVSASDDAAAQR
jgi:predicted aspartyl protease